jgi:hypothetical protein
MICVLHAADGGFYLAVGEFADTQIVAHRHFSCIKPGE